MEQGHYYLFLMQTHEVEKKKVFAKLDFSLVFLYTARQPFYSVLCTAVCHGCFPDPIITGLTKRPFYTAD